MYSFVNCYSGTRTAFPDLGIVSGVVRGTAVRSGAELCA